MLRFVAVGVVMVSVLASPAAWATKVKGKVIVTDALRESLATAEEATRNATNNGYWNEPNGVLQVEPPRVDPSVDLGVVLIKEDAPDRGADEVVTVNVLTGSLERNVVVVQPGTRIKFLAKDPYDHELYSPDHKGFPAEKQAKGAFRPIDFATVGVYRVMCKLLPHFMGWVLVTKSAKVIEVSRKGEFALSDMEPGKYRVKVFMRGEWIHEQPFEIEDEKQKELQVELKLEPKAGPAKKDAEKKADDEEEKKDEGKKDAAAK